jgi:hypothetical protein
MKQYPNFIMGDALYRIDIYKTGMDAVLNIRGAISGIDAEIAGLETEHQLPKTKKVKGQKELLDVSKLTANETLIKQRAWPRKQIEDLKKEAQYLLERLAPLEAAIYGELIAVTKAKALTLRIESAMPTVKNVARITAGFLEIGFKRVGVSRGEIPPAWSKLI